MYSVVTVYRQIHSVPHDANCQIQRSKMAEEPSSTKGKTRSSMMGGSQRKFSIKLVSSGVRPTLKKNRGKIREERSKDFNDTDNDGKIKSENADDPQTDINHRNVLFSAFYDSLLDSIVAERRAIGNEGEASKEKNSSEVYNKVSDDYMLRGEDDSPTGSKTSTKSNILQPRSPSTDSKKSTKNSQESVENITPRNISKSENYPSIERIVFKNDNIYEGETFCNLINGKGIFRWSDGTVYEGQFKNGYLTGEGRMIMPDLSVYEGSFCNGYFDGKGVLNISSTSIHYCGEWKSGKKHGNGWLMYEPENWYEGNWLGDSKSGLAFRKYKTGCKYKGNWINNIRKGQGKMMWENNDYYVGEWSENLPDGYGEYTWSIISNHSLCFPSYNWFKGSWVEGKRTGIGIMNFGTECGSKLAGTWYQNKKHGPGSMMCGNGKFIECNPLFNNDRPVHKNSRKTLSSDITVDLSVRNSFKDILALINTKVALREWPEQIILNLTKNGSNLKGNNFSKLCDSISGNKKLWCPLKIPIHSIPYEVDLTYYIDIIFDYLREEQKHESWAAAITQQDRQSKVPSENLESPLYSEKSVLLQNIPCDAISLMTEEKKSKLRDAEAYHLKNQIIINLSKLSGIYNLYASFTKKGSLSFKPVLVRLFLWQLIRDIHLTQEGVSLIQTDLILSKNPASCVETDHYPFEPIYFYQFIQSLVGCSWLQFAQEKVKCPVKFGEGFLASIFKDFLEEFVYENAGNFSGNVLTDYKDSVPITAMYNLYLNLGEPLSVKTLLNSTCTKKQVEPPCYYAYNLESKKKLVKDGYNIVSIANEIHYHPAGDTIIDNHNSPLEESKGRPKDPFYKSLYTFRSLGKKSIMHCLARICPKIIGPDLATDYSYKLTFLEFYEVLVRCALMKAEESRRDQERQLRESVQLAQRLTMTIEDKFSISTLSRTSRTKERLAKMRKKSSKKSVPTF